jgi:hypothetical protein
MATRSRIGIKLEDGQVRSIYAHWDGYPSWNGRILLTCYTDVEKINALLDLGSISSLAAEVSPPEDKKDEHSFEKPMAGVTVAYHRDRDDEEEPAKVTTEYQFYNEICEEYNYLFKDGKWFVNNRELTPAMVK